MAVIGIVLGVVGIVATIAIFVHERRRSPESVPGKPVRAPDKQRNIATWKIGRFYQSLQQFDSYCDRLENPKYALPGTDTTKPSAEDLLRFAEAVLLTAAVDIVPFSQGKANLFHFADEPTGDSRKIVSQVFIGAFPPSQVLGGMTAYRKMDIDRDKPATSVAGDCVRLRKPELVGVTKKSAFNNEEIRLGTTHILGIPAHFATAMGVDDFCRIPQEMPAAITVDLRIGRISRLLMAPIRLFAARRSKFICDRLGRYSVLAAKLEAEDQP
jgi:hypothetical protein